MAKEPDDSGGFSRFTARARDAVVAAHNAAREARNAEVAPEHLVLGLVADPGSIAAVVVDRLGVPLEAVRNAATATLGAPVDDAPEVVPYDARSRKLLELTLREALRLGHDYVGTEHLLLALLEQQTTEGGGC